MTLTPGLGGSSGFGGGYVGCFGLIGGAFLICSFGGVGPPGMGSTLAFEILTLPPGIFEICKPAGGFETLRVPLGKGVVLPSGM